MLARKHLATQKYSISYKIMRPPTAITNRWKMKLLGSEIMDLLKKTNKIKTNNLIEEVLNLQEDDVDIENL